MSRTVDQIIREQLGSLLMEVAILTSQKEKLEAELDQLKNAKPGMEIK